VAWDLEWDGAGGGVAIGGEFLDLSFVYWY
jgi:hypothetical protein